LGSRLGEPGAIIFPGDDRSLEDEAAATPLFKPTVFSILSIVFSWMVWMWLDHLATVCETRDLWNIQPEEPGVR
jgi:hypothetical protein